MENTREGRHEQEPQRTSTDGAHAIFEAFFNTVQSPDKAQVEALGVLTKWPREEILVWFNQRRASSHGDTFKFATPIRPRHFVPDSEPSNEVLTLGFSEGELPLGFPLQTRRGKRGPLSAEAREGASLLRKIGACWRCRLLKAPCTPQEPCSRCQAAVEDTLWQAIIGCQRQKLETLSLSCFPHIASTQPSITSFAIEHKFKTQIPRRVQLGYVGIMLSDNQWLDLNSSMQAFKFRGFSDLDTSEIYDCLNDKSLSLYEMSRQAAFNLTEIMVMQFSTPETRTALNCFSLLRHVARAERGAAELPDLLKSALISVISLSHLCTRRHLLGKKATNEDLSAEITLCYHTVKSFFCELEHPIMRRPIGNDDEFAQHWLSLFCAICVFSIAKSLLVDNLPWEESEQENLHIPGRINGPDHVYNVVITLFESSYRRSDLFFDSRYPHNSEIGTEIHEISKVVQRDRWDELGFKSSADFLYGLATGRVALADGYTSSSTFSGFFPQIQPPSKPVPSEPTIRKRLDLVSGPKKGLQDSFPISSAFVQSHKTTLKSLKSEYEDSDSVFPVSGYTPSMADLSETSALTKVQDNTLTLLAETAEPVFERKRRRYDEKERREVAEKRRLGSCNDCRAAKIKCVHNYGKSRDQSNKQLTDYLVSNHSHERVSLGLSSKPVGFSLLHEINETTRPLFDNSSKRTSSSNAFPTGTTEFDSTKFKCTFPGCEHCGFKRVADLQQHLDSEHNFDNYLDTFSSPKTVLAGTTKPASPEFKCTFPGCNSKRFSRLSDLNRHMQSIHNPKASMKCPVENCRSREKSWARLDKLKDHMRSAHGISNEHARELIASRKETTS